MTSGLGTAKDLQLMEELAQTMTRGAFCGLGQAAPIPIIGCLRYFREEFEQHLDKKCKTGKCSFEAADQAAA
jgi:NADH:ubiquinone oxidoreductase subunit F (NADH-binding)